ncbi:MAG: hypothetical protein ACMUJM_13835 [bacterium]
MSNFFFKKINLLFLSPQDEFGVIAVDSASHTVVDIDAVGKRAPVM